MDEIRCPVCLVAVPMRGDGTFDWHSSERYRTCPGSVKTLVEAAAL